MKIGYACVSKIDQDLEKQIQQLKLEVVKEYTKIK